jgi:hypothetical protein
MPTVCRHLETAGRRTRAELSPDDRWRAGVRGQGRIARRGCRRVALPDRRVAACGGMRPVADRAACEDDHSRERHLVHHRRARAGLDIAGAVVPVGANTAERIKKRQGKRRARRRWKPGRGRRATCAGAARFSGAQGAGADAVASFEWSVVERKPDEPFALADFGVEYEFNNHEGGQAVQEACQMACLGNGSLWPEGRVL